MRDGNEVVLGEGKHDFYARGNQSMNEGVVYMVPFGAPFTTGVVSLCRMNRTPGLGLGGTHFRNLGYEARV